MILAVWMAFLALPAADGGFGRVETVQLPPGLEVVDALVVDVDGDGLSDLVIGAAGEQAWTRELRLHLQRPEGASFRQGPDHRLELTRDVVAFAVGDVHADPGSEVVLFTAGGAFLWRPRGEGAGRFGRLIEGPFLWQIPEPDALIRWQAGLADVDGDGLVDLILPEAAGLRIALQDRSAGDARFERVFRLSVPPDELRVARPATIRTHDAATPPREPDRGGGFELRIGGVGGGVERLREPLLSIQERAPAPQLHDWDGDGDLDLLAQTNEALYAWLQGPDGFQERSSLRLALPVEVDVGRRLDLSYHARLCELDGDGRVDCIVFAGDKGSDEVRTQVLVFRQGEPDGADPLFGREGLPSQLIVLAGFVGSPRLEDVDGDGLADLVVSALRPDLIDQLMGKATDSIEAELYVYLNRGGTLSRRPDLTWRVRTSAESMRVTALFVGVVSGDGVAELLTREEPETLRLHLLRRDGPRLEVVGRPLWELPVGEEARIRLVGPDGPDPGGARDLLVLEETQVLYARFR